MAKWLVMILCTKLLCPIVPDNAIVAIQRETRGPLTTHSLTPELKTSIAPSSPPSPPLPQFLNGMLCYVCDFVKGFARSKGRTDAGGSHDEYIQPLCRIPHQPGQGPRCVCPSYDLHDNSTGEHIGRKWMVHLTLLRRNQALGLRVQCMCAVADNALRNVTAARYG